MSDFINLPKGKRPQLLTVLCILSFIGSSLSGVSNLFVYFNHEALLEALSSDAFKDIGFDLDMIANVSTEYFLISGLLNVISFNGVRQMWLMRKFGFHMYAISQLLMLISSTIYIYKPSGIFPMFDLALASVFILLYLRFRDLME